MITRHRASMSGLHGSHGLLKTKQEEFMDRSRIPAKYKSPGWPPVRRRDPIVAGVRMGGHITFSIRPACSRHWKIGTSAVT